MSGGESRQEPDLRTVIAEAERLLAKITPPPWAWEWIGEKSNEWAVGQAWGADGKPIEGELPADEWLEDTIIERRLVGMNESGHASASDAEFIAAAPRLVRELLAFLASPSAARPELKDVGAARSSATFAREFAAKQRHTEAVADCPHCAFAFLAGWVLDVLGPEPERERPPGPSDPPRRRSPEPTAHPVSESAARPEREEPHYDWECDTCHVNWKGDPKPCPKCGGKNFIHRYGSNAYELRDAVSAPSAAVAWEPIEDAPKSTEVLVLVGKARYIAYQTNQPAPMMNTWRHPNGEQLPGWPTHYLPLPPIPSSKE